MNYLLDTNVISELAKQNGNPQVRSLVGGIPETQLFLSILTIGEIAFGIEKLPEGAKKKKLSDWLLTDIPDFFRERIIALDAKIMWEWGRLTARSNRTLPVIDSFLAATALVHDLTIITRNSSDFRGIGGLALINPWEAAKDQTAVTQG